MSTELYLYYLGTQQIYYAHQIWEGCDHPIDVDEKDRNADDN